MAVLNLFSKRQKMLNAEVIDVYTYNELPSTLRVQISQIVFDSIGDNYESRLLYEDIYKQICKEYGVKYLGYPNITAKSAIDFSICEAKDNNLVLDITELCFKVINTHIRNYYYSYGVKDYAADDAVEEINIRFKEHAVGYQFEGNELIKIDSTFLHAEITKPAINLLNDLVYSGPNEEFLKAHEHYRHGRTKECLNECLKAFESTMKVICDNRGWSYSAGDTASKLISVCLDNELIPSYMLNELNALQSILKSGVPTIRNKMSGHGQGSESTVVSDYMASYMLNLTASNIVLLVNANKMYGKD